MLLSHTGNGSNPPQARENRRLKIAGLVLMGVALPALFFLIDQVESKAWLTYQDNRQVWSAVLVYLVAANVFALGLIVLLAGLKNLRLMAVHGMAAGPARCGANDDFARTERILDERACRYGREHKMESPADITWKGYSLAERDWRWQRARENAAKAGFDCILVPLCVDGRNLHLSLEQSRGTRSDCRFLTQLENAAVVLPTDGRKPIIISDEATGNDWVPEVRPVDGSWGMAMAQALIDAGMERARIGVSGIRRGFYTHGRAFHGVVNHGSYVDVLGRLPNASFDNATEVIGYARYVKSEEQIECLRRGAAIAAAGIEKMVELARPGVDEGILYSRVMQRMVSLGSEYYPMAFYSGLYGGGRLPRFEDPTEGRFLQPMYRIANEVDAVFGGLIAQEQQPILLGPIPDAWKPAIEVQRDLYYAGLEHLTPGNPFAEFVDFVNGFGEKRGLKSLMLMHGRGYGDDGPLFTPQNRGARNRDVLIEKGNVFIVKPIVTSADGGFDTSWGGCVLVTDKGGEPLVKRTPGMVAIT